MKFQRFYTKPNLPIEVQIKWATHVLKHKDGSDWPVEVPQQFSMTATRIITEKYFRKAGVPQGALDALVGEGEELNMPSWLWPRQADPGLTTGPETSAKQVFHRLCGHWTYWGWKLGLFKGDSNLDSQGKDYSDLISAKVFYDELYWMLANQIAAPNSPQFFNTGLWWAYGIEGPALGQWATLHDGHFKGEVVGTQNAYERPQPHACFIQPIKDDLVNEGGILDLILKEGRLFKQGSGTGTNFSTLREKGAPLSGGGFSSGLMSFLRIGDRSADAIQSGGITRRAAKMVIVDADHPDVEEFINWKVREESKVAALAVGSFLIQKNNRLKQVTYLNSEDLLDQALPNADAYRERLSNGFEQPFFSADWEGEAYGTVAGQNSNNSVRVEDEFMRLVGTNDHWKLISRVTREAVKSISADHLMNEICRSTWASGDPGLLFSDTINRWHTCKLDGDIVACNPCGEYQFLDDTACNLASLNLVKFLVENLIDPRDRKFNTQAFQHATRFWTVVLDISVSMASFPSKEIALRSEAYRTLGLGYANLGGLLMRCGLAYDSDEGRSLAAGLTAFMTGHSYLTSADLASELGPFPRWEANKTTMKEVINLHYNHTIDAEHPSWLYAKIQEVWESVARATSFRNAQVTLLAPTGTIGLLMDCDTMGVEPDFALKKKKNLVGGTTMTLINDSVRSGLVALEYPAHKINLIMAYIDKHNTVEGCSYLEPEHLPVFDCANAPRGFSRSISPEGHVKIVAAVQPFLSGAVSKTVNFPKEASVEDIKRVYLLAWKLGVKAIAPYRDGSKMNQPLEVSKNEDKVPTHTDFKRALELPSEVTHFPRREEVLADNKFAALQRGDREHLPWERTGGFTQKVKIDEFSLFLTANPFPDGRLGEFFMEFAGQASVLRAMGNLASILGSLALQYGAPAYKIVEAFRGLKFEPAGVVEGDSQIKLVSSVADYVGRKLALKFLDDESVADVKSFSPIREEEVHQMGEKIVALDRRAIAIAEGYSGDICPNPNCGGVHMIRQASCVRCDDCGENTGCG